MSKPKPRWKKTAFDSWSKGSAHLYYTSGGYWLVDFQGSLELKLDARINKRQHVAARAEADRRLKLIAEAILEHV